MNINKANLDALRIRAMNRMKENTSFDEQDNKIVLIATIILDAIKSMNLNGPIWWIVVRNIATIGAAIQQIVNVVKG